MKQEIEAYLRNIFEKQMAVPKDKVDCSATYYFNEREKVIAFLESVGLDFKGKGVCCAGSGLGGLLYAINKRKPKELYGFDTDYEALQISRKLNRGLLIKAGTIYDIPFNDNVFDITICNHVLEHIEDKEQAIAELFRVTKPNGHIYLEAPNYACAGEGHYKIKLYPPYCPKWLGRIILKVFGRDLAFYNNCIFPVTRRQIRRELKKYDCTFTDYTRKVSRRFQQKYLNTQFAFLVKTRGGK